MSKCILFIDGENFLHKIEEVFRKEGIDKKKTELVEIDLNKLGFEASPNKGLTYTANRTILLRNPEVIEAYPKKDC